MKINQFAQVRVKTETAKAELKRIGFPIDSIYQNDRYDLKKAFRVLLDKVILEAFDEEGKKNRLNNFLATPEIRLGDYLETPGSLDSDVFYRVALQLLGFAAGVDYSLANPRSGMAKMHLAMISRTSGWNIDDLIAAWYLLLTTHNKNGQAFLDDLAARGYFKNFKKDQPLFFNGKAQAIFSPKDLIYETVYVETDVDSDHDGKADLVKAEIIRPKTNFKLGTLFTASPYEQGTNDKLGEKLTHNVVEKLEPKPVSAESISLKGKAVKPFKRTTPVGITKKATETHEPKPGYSLNNYFLMRGFAVIYCAGIGTKDSDGIQTCGSDEQVKSMTSVIKWLTNQLPAFTDRTGLNKIKASWSNGLVAMTGRSYLGTLAEAAACTGIKGLKTIIPEAAISSWYDYYRENGLVRAPMGFPGEDADVLAAETFSRKLSLGDYLKVAPLFKQSLLNIEHGMDRKTGNYNQFWEDRNYRRQIKNVHADVLLVQGLNDWNVMPAQAGHF